MVKVNYKVYPDSQRGIIAIEYSGYRHVLNAKYGTYGEFKRIAKEGITSPYGEHIKLSKTHTMGMNDDWKGINYWITAKGYGDNPDLTFFVFHKDDGKDVTPTKKLSQFFGDYEKYLRKR